MEHHEQGPAGPFRTGIVGASLGVAPPGGSCGTDPLPAVEGCSQGH